MRKNIVAGNWKMNKNVTQSMALISDLKEALRDLSIRCRVIISPPSVNLHPAIMQTQDSLIEVAAQNMHQATNGAYTGEISADMLRDIGVRTVIIGHSERRTYFGEDEAILTQKVVSAIENKLEVIFCFGELLEERMAENHFNVVERQLREVVFSLDPAAWKHIILAYEPVWAIGTGETASPEQAQEMHAFTRDLVESVYGKNIADHVSILYGGSVKPTNAEEIFSKKDVDGGLIGGASLNVNDFTEIIKVF